MKAKQIGWSDWMVFDKETVNAFLPDELGIYRLRTAGDVQFILKRDDDGSVYWTADFNVTEANRKKIEDSDPMLVINNKDNVFTFLVYAGSSVDGSLKKRLLSLLSSKKKTGLRNLLDVKLPLGVSYMLTTQPEHDEARFVEEYTTITKGFYPPCDCDMNLSAH
ncbi:MAG: hypothetical protein WCM76_10215 [Bacteroidota bacterium]